MIELEVIGNHGTQCLEIAGIVGIEELSIQRLYRFEEVRGLGGGLCVDWPRAQNQRE